MGERSVSNHGTFRAQTIRCRSVVRAALSAMVIGASATALVQVIPWSAASARVASTPVTWQERAAQIRGVISFRDSGAPLSREHAWGLRSYEQSPPVGGVHNPVWQQCMGDIYDAPIAAEHAVHSLEHGAVWLTYRGDLSAEEVYVLEGKVWGKDYTFVSPYAGLDAKVSLQAWGYQLRVDDVNDPRIDEFISVFAKNASLEPGATCSGGNTATGTVPLTEQQAQQRLAAQ